MDNKISTIFRSCHECPREIECKVVGSIPEWLHGSFIRLGPGKWDLEGKNNFTMSHWLDGYAMLIKFRMEDGRVFFSSKFLRSTAYTKMIANGLPVFPEFGTRAYPDTSKGIVSRFWERLVPHQLTDNDISNIYLLNKRLFVGTESCNIWKIDPANITGVEKFNLDKEAKIELGSSHPLHSPKENCYYTIGTEYELSRRYHLYRIPATNDPTINPFKGAEIICTIPSRWKNAFSFIHSFAMTENFIVLIEHPLIVSSVKLASASLTGRSVEQCLEWHPDEPTRFYVIKKSTGEEQSLDYEYETDSFFFFHIINAYEQDEHLIIDLVAYDDYKILEKYHLQFLRSNQFGDYCQPTPRRYVLPLESKMKDLDRDPEQELVTLPNCSASAQIVKGSIKLVYEQLTEPGFELPTMNSSYAAHEHRFVYGSGTFEPGFFTRSAIKLDIKEKEVRIWRPSKTAFPGEAVFVPKPDIQNEDDGIILSVVLESDEAKDNFLVILDARTMHELARMIVPKDSADIPPTIHGIFIPNIKEIIV